MIIRKAVAFNITDPDQKAMLDHANLRSNFSGYIRRLIQRDMEGGVPSWEISPKEEPVSEEAEEGNTLAIECPVRTLYANTGPTYYHFSRKE